MGVTMNPTAFGRNVHAGREPAQGRTTTGANHSSATSIDARIDTLAIEVPAGWRPASDSGTLRGRIAQALEGQFEHRPELESLTPEQRRLTIERTAAELERAVLRGLAEAPPARAALGDSSPERVLPT